MAAAAFSFESVDKLYYVDPGNHLSTEEMVEFLQGLIEEKHPETWIYFPSVPLQRIGHNMYYQEVSLGHFKVAGNIYLGRAANACDYAVSAVVQVIYRCGYYEGGNLDFRLFWQEGTEKLEDDYATEEVLLEELQYYCNWSEEMALYKAPFISKNMASVRKEIFEGMHVMFDLACDNKAVLMGTASNGQQFYQKA